MLEILQIVLKALGSEFTVVEPARSKFISVSSESKPNSDSSDEREMILKQNLDVLVPKYIGTISFVFHFLEKIRLYRTAAILDWRHVLLTPMRGHACEGQLPVIGKTRRSPAIMPNRDHCYGPQCQNNRAKNIPDLTFHQFPSDEPIRKLWVVKIRRDVGKSFQLVRLSMILLRTWIYINYYDLVHLQITNSTRVCSVHLKDANLKTTLTGKRVLEKHAVPSIFWWSRSPRERKSPKKREPPRARVRLFDVSVPLSPVTVTGKYCCRYFFNHPSVKIVK